MRWSDWDKVKRSKGHTAQFDKKTPVTPAAPEYAADKTKKAPALRCNFALSKKRD